ncbi:hypothetical protein M0R04_09985 [Candidatus Dojkabacteria bacterium]|jgi:hypothetical protein|nr:hypothetical protein [Candidatus Dojkabacteria bacterium]
MTYTYQNFYDALNGLLHGKVKNLQDPRVTINRAIRIVNAEVDTESTIRQSALVPYLFTDVFDYACPADLKATAVIDLIPQINRSRYFGLDLVPSEEFDRNKNWEKNIIAFYDHDGLRRMRISVVIDDDSKLISELDSLTSGGGTWKAFGDATNLVVDNFNYVSGNASIKWDISAAGGTTAGIYNDDLDEFDLTDEYIDGSLFYEQYLSSNLLITNFKIRVGSSASDYYEKTITSNNEGTAFVSGWNLNRHDLVSMTQVGTPDITKCTYVAIFMTKDASKISETSYRTDWFMARRGRIHDLQYYSRYGWQTSAGVYILDSTAVTDYLNAGEDEFELYLFKAGELGAAELRDKETYAQDYKDKKKSYTMSTPSKAKIMTSSYYELDSGFNNFDSSNYRRDLNDI